MLKRQEERERMRVRKRERQKKIKKYENFGVAKERERVIEKEREVNKGLCDKITNLA